MCENSFAFSLPKCPSNQHCNNDGVEKIGNLFKCLSQRCANLRTITNRDISPFPHISPKLAGVKMLFVRTMVALCCAVAGARAAYTTMLGVYSSADITALRTLVTDTLSLDPATATDTAP